ncbi:polyketide synthase dehydratase domain-containing protein, partial [Streptomyces sp. HSW2009]|uniref:polyketide synthase dehydratase domain-containing protein n=1 Tax=Streptomyces sp. HSW2009 TaxID=3142890 RepID=UPI0032ED1418
MGPPAPVELADAQGPSGSGGGGGGGGPPVGAEVVSVGGVYEDLVGRGLEYGPVFRGVEGVWRR